MTTKAGSGAITSDDFRRLNIEEPMPHWWKLLGLDGIAFIAGCGHTGTTLMATILSAHPDVYLPMRETSIFVRRSTFGAARKMFGLALKARRDGKHALVEKTPRHVRETPFIRRVVPGCRFVLMVRDGRDVVLSLAVRVPWEQAVERWLQDTSLAACETGKDDVLIVRYESLIEEPERTIGQVCAFLGLAFDSVMLDYHRRPRLWFGERAVVDATPETLDGHNAHRNWQVNQPLFDGRGQWRKRALPPEFSSFFTRDDARALQSAFGYEMGK
jgi:hypothetical protein